MRTLLALGLTALACSIARADEPVPCSPVVPDLTGRWTGCWVSDKNGHHGPIRAHITQVSGSCYRIRFTGRFWKVVPFVYSLTLRVVETQPGAVVLAGGMNLGPLLGHIHCEARVTACQFDARFSAKNDLGRFVLTRPGH
jgi:hypothetical protein